MVSIAGAQTFVSHMQGCILPNAPDYDWWYGCSPTSAGMLMGYYDINGYNGLSYANLVPGKEAELSNYGRSGSAANQMIASCGHIHAFYRDSDDEGDEEYGDSGEDLPRDPAFFNCLADFMGTSQDAAENSNGSTTFFYYSDGDRTDAWVLDEYELTDRSGIIGMWEYLQYAGYGEGELEDQMIYNQYIDAMGLDFGFTWENYMAEIDAGRPVLIHVEGHTMFGYGYDALTNEILLHDTWYEGEHRMAWGGAYPYSDEISLLHYGVTVFEPSGGAPIPEPGTFLLLGVGLLGLAIYRKKRK